jgi:hypothetical protein
MSSVPTSGTASSTTGNTANAFAIMRQDHEEFRRVFAEYRQVFNGSDDEAIGAFIRVFCAWMAMHTSLEERYLYPMYSTKMGSATGAPWFDESVHSHQADKENLVLLEQGTAIQGGRAKLISLMETIEAITVPHMLKEEQEYWPSLEVKLSFAEREALHRDIVNARDSVFTPTHPHPHGPTNPMLAKIMHPLAGIYDHVYDRVTGKSTVNTTINTTTASTTSHTM